MEFYTKKFQRILSAFEVAFGISLFIGFVCCGVILTKMGNINVPHKEIVAVVGSEPTLADFGGGEKLIKAKEEYSKQYRAEKDRQMEILSQERKEILRPKFIKAGLASLIGFVIVFIFYLLRTVKSFKIEGDSIIFTYVNNREKELSIKDNRVEFRRIKFYSIRYLFIPRMFNQFYYYTKGSKKDLETVHISKEDGLKVLEYFSQNESN